MRCPKCETPLMYTYAVPSGWIKNCIKCGVEEATSAPAHVSIDAGKKARIGYSAFLTQDFKRAENAFAAASDLCEDVPEYLWAMLLARYGVKYCCVPENRGLRHSYVINYWRDDFPDVLPGDTAEFEQICNQACLIGPQWNAYYKQECKAIDRGLKQIRALRAGGENYDIFLCFKDTDEDDDYEMTRERRLLDLVYPELITSGARVFYAPRSMQGKDVYDYEGYIHHALRTSKLMVVLSGAPKNVRSEWVKSEWMRFLQWNENQQERVMTYTVGAMSPGDFPVQLRNIQSQGHADDIDIKTAKVIAGDIQLHYLKDLLREGTKSKETTKEDPVKTIRKEQKPAKESLEKTDPGNRKPKKNEPQKERKREEKPTAAMPDTEELYRKGELAAQKNSVEGNEEAAAWYRCAAERGYAPAQYALGVCCQDGIGVAKDEREAFRLFGLAAEQGHTEAQYMLGRCYMGIGTDANDKEAVKWLRLAADRGYAPAQNWLGTCYRLGRGVKKDEMLAAQLYRLAADQGNVTAQNNIGYCYKCGVGVEQDNHEAVRWYRLAAEQGNAVSMNNLALCYEDGVGVVRDYREAVRLYRLAAEQGNEMALYNLGRMYQLGNGVQRDIIEAKRLYRLSAQKGFKKASEALKSLENT